MGYYRLEVGEELRLLPVLDLVLQMDCYLDGVALEPRHLLEQQVLLLLVQVVVLEQRVGEGEPKLALSIQPEYQVGCECSHRVEQLQHQSLPELALLF